MEGISAKFLLLEGAKSDALQNAFSLVSQAETNGIEKFTPAVTKQLARDITCRNYAPVIHELCHLIVVADGCGTGPDRYEAFFWGSGPARTENFVRHIRLATCDGRNWRSDYLILLEDGVEAQFPDGRFYTSFARMPALSAMMEFLLTALEYDGVDRVIERMLEGDLTARSVSDTANELSCQLYGYLSEHLPSAQNQRKFRRLTSFLEGQLGETFDSKDIGDDAVLDFWIAESANQESDSLDFRTFRSVFHAFIRLIQSLEQARTRFSLSKAVPIGSDRDAGEVDPASLAEAFDTIHEQADSLKRLDESPLNQVKFLNRREMKNLELLSGCGTTALQVPLSILRAEVFGDAQSRISQALRSKVANAKLSALFRNAAREDYDARRLRFEELGHHLERVLLASLFVLLRSRRPEAISLLLRLRPDVDLTGLAERLTGFEPDDDSVIRLGGGSVADHFMALLEDPDEAGEALATLMAEARAAYRSLSRTGFTDTDQGNDEHGDVFAAAGEILTGLRDALSKFDRRLKSLDVADEGWPERYRRDMQIFADQFEKLYGGRR